MRGYPSCEVTRCCRLSGARRVVEEVDRRAPILPRTCPIKLGEAAAALTQQFTLVIWLAITFHASAPLAGRANQFVNLSHPIAMT
jgi:hypothetical protein